jgi:hypothetical protein
VADKDCRPSVGRAQKARQCALRTINAGASACARSLSESDLVEREDAAVARDLRRDSAPDQGRSADGM